MSDDKTSAAWTPSDAVAEWFAGKDPAELEVIELGSGQRLYPDSLKRKAKDGSVEERKVRIRAPNSRDKALARLDALAWARKLAAEHGRPGLSESLTITEAEAIIGPTYFAELDTKSLVARCVHEWAPPHDQYMLPEFLDNSFEHAAIMDIWERINFWFNYQDVRVGELTEDQFLEVLAAIDRVRNTSPLAAIGGSAQDSFIVSMAVRLRSFLKPLPS